MVIILPHCHINLYPGGWVLIVAQCCRFKNYFKFPSTINCCQFSDTQWLALHFILFTLLPRPNSAYNPQTTNNFSKVIPLIHQTVQFPKSVCTLINEDAEKQDEEHVTDEDIKSKYLDIIVETSDITTVTTSDHCGLTLALNAINQDSQ